MLDPRRVVDAQVRRPAVRNVPGRAPVAADGSYRFRTIRPAHYAGRTPHIHVKVKLAQRDLLTTQLYAEGDPHNAGDGLWRRLNAAAVR